MDKDSVSNKQRLSRSSQGLPNDGLQARSKAQRPLNLRLRSLETCFDNRTPSNLTLQQALLNPIPKNGDSKKAWRTTIGFGCLFFCLSLIYRRDSCRCAAGSARHRPRANLPCSVTAYNLNQLHKSQTPQEGTALASLTMNPEATEATQKPCIRGLYRQTRVLKAFCLLYYSQRTKGRLQSTVFTR